MEKHERIHLYLDHDETGKRCLDIVLNVPINIKMKAVCIMVTKIKRLLEARLKIIVSDMENKSK